MPPPLTPHLFGRADELRLLDEAWANPSTNLVVFHALGGAGKSALVSKWLAQMAAKNYDGARRVFGWSFFSQGSSENRSDSSEAFIDSALAFFGVTVEGDYFRKADRLAEALRAERSILILDGVEPLQYPPNSAGLPEGGLKDRALQTILTQLAAQQPGLCVITSRERLSDLNGYDEATVIQRALDHLPYATTTAEQPCAQLLRALGAAGDDAEMLAAAQEFQGHAYGLTLLGSYVAEVLGGDLRRRKDIANLFDDDRFGSQADRMIAAYETWLGDGVEVAVLRLLGLFDRPAEAASIAALREAPAIAGLTEMLQGLSEVKWQQALSRLRRRNLLSPANPHAPGELDAHALVREHFRQQLKALKPTTWQAGNLRVYKHLLTYTTVEFPSTLAEMQPLFAAVTHGCAAGLHQHALDDVYWRRINREREFFSTDKLGALHSDLAALAGFFLNLWDTPIETIPITRQTFVLNAAGYRLRAVGRLQEAVQPMQSALNIALVYQNWEDANVYSGNLSQLFLTLGKLRLARRAGQQRIEIANSLPSNRTFPTLVYSSLADALHQLGRIDEAEELFRTAEAKLIETYSGYPNISTLPGFRFNDLLLSQMKTLEVQKRIESAQQLFASSYSILDWAVDELALGRAKLLEAIANNYPDDESRYEVFAQSGSILNCALARFRNSGRKDFLPLGLLAHAAWARVAQQYEQAHRDLAEARAIAERGEMRLHLTDYHLESARLALALHDAAQAREHYDAVRKLIDETGYHRRDGELQEIAEALAGRKAI